MVSGSIAMTPYTLPETLPLGSVSAVSPLLSSRQTLSSPLLSAITWAGAEAVGGFASWCGWGPGWWIAQSRLLSSLSSRHNLSSPLLSATTPLLGINSN
jgi:hypothetical protein